MSHGLYNYHLATIASGDSLSSAIDLKRAHNSVYVEIQSLSSQADLRILASSELTGTYRPIYHPVINSSTAGANVFIIPSAVTNAMVPIPSGFRFLKIQHSLTVTNGGNFRFVTADMGN